MGDLIDTIQIPGFELNLPNGSFIDARDEFSPSILISVLDPLGNDIVNLTSYPKQVVPLESVQEDSEPYLLNCPNPFGESGNELTNIVYYLKEQSSVSFYIYTLTGKFVWSEKYLETEPEGLAGLHDLGRGSVVWDGRNNNGYRVLNGVYILVMKTGYGDVAKTKIAVVK